MISMLDMLQRVRDVERAIAQIDAESTLENYEDLIQKGDGDAEG